ncbi:MAG TPA: ABC transporter substrate-binding protein [Opitutaceae bacterium]|nr:ABC transporter substrate-binding protein [Opitutaceae bacterium]
MIPSTKIPKTLAWLGVFQFVFQASAETIRVAIGTQDTTINCAAGGPVVRELKLLEKYLPHDGKYRDVEYNIIWENQPTGAQLNSKYLANQLDIVQMADFPSIVGATAFEAANNGVHSIYIASLSGGISGAGNAILVPNNSRVQSLSELKGKRISVPFASTAHAMLIRAIQDLGWDPNSDVTIISQTPEVGGSALKAGQIDAHANFVPFGELFPFRGIARKIYDGSLTGVTTTHGVQVRSDYVAKYPEIVVAYLRAMLEASKLLEEKPEELSEKLEKWTGVEAEVYYAFHGPQGIQTRDYSLKPEFVTAIRRAQEALKVLKKVPREVSIDLYVKDEYIREAAKQSGLDYEAQLKNYAPLPFRGNALDTSAPVTDAKRAGQIWVKGEEKVRLYSTAEAALREVKKLKADRKTLRVIFVHDRVSGLKLFADRAWYVVNRGEASAFLLKADADKWAKDHDGAAESYEDVLAKI